MTDSLQRYLAELFGTFTLVFIGTTGILAAQGRAGTDIVLIGLVFGFALLAALYAFADVSGGHFNPAVSLAMFFDRRLEAGDMIAYWVAQLAGAVLASLSVLIAFDQDAVAATVTTATVGTWEALFLEILATAIFVIVILHSTKGERHRGTALVAIPLTLAAANLALAPFSGASLNTARSFGPALIGSEWSDFWIYIVGPLAGAIIGWVVYAVVVRPPEGSEPSPHPQPQHQGAAS